MKKITLIAGLMTILATNCFAQSEPAAEEKLEAKLNCKPAFALVSKNDQGEQLLLIQMSNPEVKEDMAGFEKIAIVEPIIVCPLRDGSMLITSIPPKSEVFK